MTKIDIIALVTSALTSRDAAVDARVTLDVFKWGKAERDHSRAAASQRSHGLVVNSIVHDPIADYGDAVPEPLKQAAKALLTPEDRAVLRRGG